MSGPRKDFQPGFLAWQVRKLQRQEALREELKDGFPRKNRLVLEIGCGHGHFLNAYAAAHPDHFCVGIDRIIERVRRATKKQRRGDLENLRFIRADAGEFIECLPESVRFDRVFILFPDPWPKKRHYKNRLITDSFLDVLADRTFIGADLYFRTDYRPYFEEVAERVGKHPRWEVDLDGEWPFEESTVFQERAESFDSLVARKIDEKTLEEVHREDHADLNQEGDQEKCVGEDKKGIESLSDFT